MADNLSKIFYALTLKEIYLVLLFYILSGLMQPSFGEFGYFFTLSICKITKFQFAACGLVTKVACVFGTWYYKEFLKDTETRTIIFWGTVMGCVSTGASLAWALRWNMVIGVSDLAFIVLTDIVFGVLGRALNILPCLALFAKVTPKGIEGTIFAFLTGCCNLADGVIAPALGTYINHKFVHVTSKDFEQGNLHGFVTLKLINFVTAFLPFLILALIPLADDIKKWQEERLPQKQE